MVFFIWYYFLLYLSLFCIRVLPGISVESTIHMNSIFVNLGKTNPDFPNNWYQSQGSAEYALWLQCYLNLPHHKRFL